MRGAANPLAGINFPRVGTICRGCPSSSHAPSHAPPGAARMDHACRRMGAWNIANQGVDSLKHASAGSDFQWDDAVAGPEPLPWSLVRSPDEQAFLEPPALGPPFRHSP